MEGTGEDYPTVTLSTGTKSTTNLAKVVWELATDTRDLLVSFLDSALKYL